MDHGEQWNPETWGAWADTLLLLQWEGAGRGGMPLEWYEWDDFQSEWFRSLFDGGKECGFVVYEKR